MLQRDRHRRLLAVALFPSGALAVHQLRYLLAFGPEAPHEVAGEGHGYLPALTPWIILAVAFGLGGLLARLAHAWRTGDAGCGRGRGLVRLWVLAAAGLLAIYAGQEFLEGLYANGLAQGLAGIFGDGGLWALPASVAVGGVLAVIVRGGRALVARVAQLRRTRGRSDARRAPRLGARRDVVVLVRLAPLAGASAGRAPPSY